MRQEDILQDRKEIRRLERLLRRSDMPTPLEKAILDAVPSSLLPGNVGGYYNVAWPFTYTIQFDMGDDPTYGPNTKQVQSFQNTQEAAFIFLAMSWKPYAYSTSGALAPLTLTIKDRQSTRQFNDRPVPIQCIAKKIPYTLFEVPLVIMPNAFMDLEMTSWLSANQATLGSGKHSFSFMGYRTRTENIGQVLSTVYGGK